MALSFDLKARYENAIKTYFQALKRAEGDKSVNYRLKGERYAVLYGETLQTKGMEGISFDFLGKKRAVLCSTPASAFMLRQGQLSAEEFLEFQDVCQDEFAKASLPFHRSISVPEPSPANC